MMMIKNKLTYIFITGLLFIAPNCFSQLSEYNYEAEINNVTDTWHVIKLPDPSFSLIKNDYSDIRIYGISETDTIEVPYIKEVLADKKTSTKVSVSIINRAKSSKGSFFTIKNDDAKEINEIELVFKEENFDWEARVEGSNDNNNWFTISEKERLVSLKKETINFKATTISFPTVNYKFIRILIKNVNDSNLVNALIYDNKIVKGEEVIFDGKSQSVVENKTHKTTAISIQLKEKVPVSKIEILVNSEIDYYRRIHLKTLKDSVVLENRTRYDYTDLGSFEISSYRKNILVLNHILVDNLIIEIDNLDNQPLSIGNVAVSGNPVVLKARFPKEKLNYVLAVGNKYAHTPNYDIASFVNNIPKELKLLSTNGFTTISKEAIVKKGPVLPFPKYVLWIILLSVIAILGFFTFKMFKK